MHGKMTTSELLRRIRISRKTCHHHSTPVSCQPQKMGNEPRESLTAQDFYDLKILNTQPSAKLNTQPQDDSDEKYSSEMTRFKSLNKLLNANILWSKAMYQKDVNFFTSLSLQQSPKLCWIGCSDSRVPANQIVSLAPGEIFVHRNIANVVQPTDLNVFSVLEYAIEVLKVEHVMVVGHYG